MSLNLRLNHAKVNQGIPHNIKLDAGNDILQENEEIWKHLHEASEINAEKAEEIDRTITRIKDKFEDISTNLGKLNVALEVLNLQEILNNCISTVKVIQNESQRLEGKLIEYGDICEEVNLHEKQLEHKVQMALYKQKKLSELELVRQKLAEQHEKNVQIYEEELKKVQLERQAAFQIAFQLDLELYKQQGSLPRVTPTPCSMPQLSLEDVHLEEGEDSRNEFENFLKE